MFARRSLRDRCSLARRTSFGLAALSALTFSLTLQSYRPSSFQPKFLAKHLLSRQHLRSLTQTILLSPVEVLQSTPLFFQKALSVALWCSTPLGPPAPTSRACYFSPGRSTPGRTQSTNWKFSWVCSRDTARNALKCRFLQRHSRLLHRQASGCFSTGRLAQLLLTLLISHKVVESQWLAAMGAPLLRIFEILENYCPPVIARHQAGGFEALNPYLFI